jgi:TonB family protein
MLRIAGVLLLSCSATRAPAAEDPVAVEVFKAPKAIKAPLPSYPKRESEELNEGWVHVNFMVSPQGEPYEIVVVESTGIKAFERTAINTVKNWRFEPATLGNTPIDASQNLKMVFTMDEPATAASSEFARAYRGVMKAIDADDRARADEALAKMRVENLYEDAYKNFANFHYHRKWGTEAQQLNALRRAIARENAPRYLKKDLFAGALDTLLVLEVRASDFAHALETWEKLQPIASKEMLKKWPPVIDEVRTLKTSDKAFRMKAEIGQGASWYGDLFRNRFEILVTSGQVSEIKLRCEKKYVFFRYEPNLRYTVDPRHGNCGIEIVGEPDTKFDLIQS